MCDYEFTRCIYETLTLDIGLVDVEKISDFYLADVMMTNASGNSSFLTLYDIMIGSEISEFRNGPMKTLDKNLQAVHWACQMRRTERVHTISRCDVQTQINHANDHEYAACGFDSIMLRPLFVLCVLCACCTFFLALTKSYDRCKNKDLSNVEFELCTRDANTYSVAV